MSKKNQNYTNRKQNRFQPERMRGNVFVNNSGKQWLPGENGRAAKVERLLRGAKEEKKEIAGNMAGYKDSGVEWIGAIPKGWKISRLKYVSDIYTAKPHPYFGPDEDFIFAKNDKPYDIFSSPNGEWVSSGYDLIITGRVGTIGRYEKLLKKRKNKVAVTDNRLIIKPKDEALNILINYAYLFWTMHIVSLKDIIYGSAVPLITATSLLKKYIPLPPLQEQQRIADFLDTKCDTLDRTIDTVSRQIEDLEKYKKALITKTVTKGICKKGEPERKMKDSGVEWIGDVPEEWNVKRLKYVLDSIRNGAPAAAVEYSPELPRYIRISDITKDNKLKNDNKQSIASNASKGFILDKEAVLISNAGTIGKPFFFNPNEIKEQCSFACQLIEAITKPDTMLNKYLYYFILSDTYINWVNRIFTQTTIKHATATQHKNLPVTVPLLAEQQQIADYLDEKCKNIDNRVQKRRQQLEWLKEYKRSLIFDYVTGKKRV